MKIEIVERNGIYYVTKDGVSVSKRGCRVTIPAEFRSYSDAKKRYDELVEYYSSKEPKGNIINSIEL